MTIHSVVSLQAISRKSKAEPGAPGPKRDAILRAAIDVFADRGYFNAQVADVARAAGVAAGTVYLYFRSKDDLLISIFERGMRAALEEGRGALDEMATNWILSRRRYSLEAEADVVVDLFLNGAKGARGR